MSRLTSRGWTSVDASAFMKRSNGPHTVRWKANVYRGTEMIAEDLPLVDGRLTLDSSDPIRRHLTLEVGGGEQWLPKTSSSPLVPFGQRVTLWVTIDRDDGSWFPWLKMGEYQIFTHSFERPSLITTIECHDMAGAVHEYLILGRRSFVGETLHDAITALCEEAVPGYVFAVNSSDYAKDEAKAIKSYVADAGESRWDAATGIATNRGHECFFDWNGDLVLRHDVTDDNDEAIPGVGPDIGTVSNPIATITDGINGNMLGLTATVSREGACNGVRINLHSTVPRKVRKKADRDAGVSGNSCGSGEQSSTVDWEDAPIYKGILEAQTTGPVAWGGLFGRIPIVIEKNVKDLKRWSSGGEETWSDAQADAHADAKRLLHRRRGLTRYLDLHTLPLYWLEPDDKVAVRWHEQSGTVVTEAHYVQRVELGLNDGKMVVRTRQLNVTDPGADVAGSKPKAQPAYRVPRSKVDDRFNRSNPLPGVKVGAGEVVSVSADGETMTVDMDGEHVSGVAVLGCPPDVGDWVEVDERGDLLVSPEAASDWGTITGIGGGVVYVQPDEPVFAPVGTLWFDTDEVRP